MKYTRYKGPKDSYDKDTYKGVPYYTTDTREILLDGITYSRRTYPDAQIGLNVGWNIEESLNDPNYQVPRKWNYVILSQPTTKLNTNNFLQNDFLLTISGDFVESIPEFGFMGCTELRSIRFNQCKTIEKKAFSACYSLSNVCLPKVESVGESAFEACSSLTSISLPECKIVKDSGFVTCSSLANVLLPKCEILEKYSFALSSLIEITLPKIVTIKSKAFNGANSIVKLTLGDTLTTIESKACETLTNLKVIEFLGTKAQWDKISIAPDAFPQQIYVHCLDQTFKL